MGRLKEPVEFQFHSAFKNIFKLIVQNVKLSQKLILFEIYFFQSAIKIIMFRDRVKEMAVNHPDMKASGYWKNNLFINLGGDR